MFRALTNLFLGILVLIAIVWTFGAIQFLPTLTSLNRIVAWSILGLACVLLIIRSTRHLGFALLTLATLCMVGVFFSVPARNDRAWETSVAKLPRVERVSDNIVTIRNVRNFRYTTESDFVPQYYDKTVDLTQLTSVDFFVSYWAGKELAHIMVSFGFAEKDFLTFSIETRKEVSESYSTFAGFYRNYELTYVVADERDLVGLRTKIRNPNERVHLLRTRIPPERARKLLTQYLNEIDSLNIEPQFYNTLTTNCTTQILRHVQSYNSTLVYNWKVFLSGYLPEYMYQLNAVDTNVSFEKLFADSQINDRANQDIVSEGFSARIREGLIKPPFVFIN